MLSSEVKHEISGVARRASKIEAMIKLKEQAKLGIAEAKAVALHFSAQGDVCHRCNRELPDGDEVVCPKCHSLNLKW